MGSTVGGGDEVGDGFGLTEVELAVEVGTHGELTRTGQAATFLHEKVENGVEDVAGTVTGDFPGVLASVASGSTEDGEDDVVYDFVVSDDMGVVDRGTAKLGSLDNYEGGDDGEGVGATDPDDAEGTTRGGGKSADGVVHKMRVVLR